MAVTRRLRGIAVAGAIVVLLAAAGSAVALASGSTPTYQGCVGALGRALGAAELSTPPRIRGALAA